MPGVPPGDIAQGQRWIARIDAERADLEARYPSNVPGHRPQGTDDRKRALRERRKEINVALARIAPHGSRETVTVPNRSVARPAARDPRAAMVSSLERKMAELAAVSGERVTAASLVRANHHLAQILLERLRLALGLPEHTAEWEGDRDSFLTKEEGLILGCTRRWLRLQEEEIAP